MLVDLPVILIQMFMVQTAVTVDTASDNNGTIIMVKIPICHNQNTFFVT